METSVNIGRMRKWLQNRPTYVPLANLFAETWYTSSVIYFLQVKGPRGPVKIGHTRDQYSFPGRFKELQAGNDEPLVLLDLIKDGHLELEKWMHYKLRHNWIRGEWFKWSAVIEELLELGKTARSVDAFLAEYDVSSRDIVKHHREITIRARKECLACQRMLVAGQKAGIVATVAVHLACAEVPPPDPKYRTKEKLERLTFPVCEICGASIFKGEKQGSAKRHKRCQAEPKVQGDSKARRRTPREEQELRELKIRRGRHKQRKIDDNTKLA